MGSIAFLAVAILTPIFMWALGLDDAHPLIFIGISGLLLVGLVFQIFNASGDQTP